MTVIDILEADGTVIIGGKHKNVPPSKQRHLTNRRNTGKVIVTGVKDRNTRQVSKVITVATVNDMEAFWGTLDRMVILA